MPNFLARGPKRGDELVLGPVGFLGKLGAIAIGHRLAGQRARDGNAKPPPLAIPPEDHHLAPLEERGQLARVDRVGLQLAEVDRHLGEHRVRKPVVEGRDLGVDVLLGQHVLAAPLGRLGQPVQEVRVHVVAHPHHEDPRGARLERLDALEDLLGHQLAGRGRAVREEDGDPRPARGRLALERLGQRPADVRAPLGDHPFDVLPGRFERLFIAGRRGFAEAGHLGAEGDDVEAVARVEVLDAVVDGRPGLLDLLAPHRPARVEHEHHVLVQNLFIGGAPRGIAQEHEVTVLLVGLAVTEHAEAQRVGVGDPGQAEVVLARVVVGLHADLGPVKPVALDLGLVRGAEHGPKRRPFLAGHGGCDREPGYRLGREGHGRRGQAEPGDALALVDRLPEVDDDLQLAADFELRHQHGRAPRESEDRHGIELPRGRLVEGLGRVGSKVARPGEHGVVAVGDARRHDDAVGSGSGRQGDQAQALHGPARPLDGLLHTDGRLGAFDRGRDRAVAECVERCFHVGVGDVLAGFPLAGQEDRPGLGNGRRE